MYVLVRWNDASDKDITDKTKFNVVGEGIQTPSLSGLVPELEYFQLRNKLTINEDVDPLLAIVQESKTLIEDTVPVIGADQQEYQLRQYDESYTVVMRSDEDLIDTICEFEANSNNKVFPLQKQFKYILFYAMGVKRLLDGGELTDNQQLIMDRVEAKGLKMWQNWMTAISKEEAIKTGDELKIAEDWETIDPEDVSESN